MMDRVKRHTVCVARDGAVCPHLDFVPPTSDPYHLFRLLNDLRTLFKS
jgi:hypothetical protein